MITNIYQSECYPDSVSKNKPRFVKCVFLSCLGE